MTVLPWCCRARMVVPWKSCSVSLRWFMLMPAYPKKIHSVWF